MLCERIHGVKLTLMPAGSALRVEPAVKVKYKDEKLTLMHAGRRSRLPGPAKGRHLYLMNMVNSQDIRCKG